MPRTKLALPNFYLGKRRDGYYEVRYEEGGETRTKAAGTKDPKEAEAFRARFAQDYRKPKLSGRATVAALCEAYIAYRKPLVASVAGLEYAYGPVLRHMGPLYADSVTQTVVDDYATKRLTERPERKGGRYGDKPVGEATVSKELRMLRAALNWGASEQILDRQPTFRVELSAGDTRLRWITKDEANKLMEECAPHVALFILIGLSTAKRREAILSLTWDRVNLARQGHEYIDFGDDVGNKRKGETPIAGNTRLIQALREAKVKAQSNYVIEYRGDRVKDVKVALSAACRRAGIEEISAHVLKHTCITWMVQAGVSFERIAKFANTSKDVVERVYGHHSPEFVREAVAAVAF